MKRCPNCDRMAVRTKDWACQWCGYPLISNSYRKVEMTLREVKEERMPRPPVTAMDEAEPEPEPEPESEPVAEIELEPEDSETEPGEKSALELAAEVESQPAIESVPEPVAEPAPEEVPKPKPRARRKPAAKSKSTAKNKTAAAPKATEAETATEAEAETTTEAEPETEPPKPARRARVSRAKAAPAATSEAGQPDMEISIDDVLGDYENDGEAAEARYGGKILRLTGMIERVEVKDDLDIFYATLNSEKEARIQGVRCVFDRAHSVELSRLETGQTVTIQGNFSGSLIDISLRDCFVSG